MTGRGLILALDLESERDLLEVAHQAGPYVDGFKVGNVALYEHGWRIIRSIKAVCDKPVMADLKLMEVPFIGERLARRANESGADALLVCGSSGMDTVGFCRTAFPGRLFLLTQFTHCRDVIPDDQGDAVVRMAAALGCDGVQVPATFPERIQRVRSYLHRRCEIICCGIGRQGSPVGSAIAAGANYEIVGRDIYAPIDASESPRMAAKKVREGILRVLSGQHAAAAHYSLGDPFWNSRHTSQPGDGSRDVES